VSTTAWAGSTSLPRRPRPCRKPAADDRAAVSHRCADEGPGRRLPESTNRRCPTGPARSATPSSRRRSAAARAQIALRSRGASCSSARCCSFFGTAHLGLDGRPAGSLLQGNLSAASLAGTIPLADPFASRCRCSPPATCCCPSCGSAPRLSSPPGCCSARRAFCAWMCPPQRRHRRRSVAARAARLARPARHPHDDTLRPARARARPLRIARRRGVRVGEPIGMLHRALVYGTPVGLVAVAGVLLLDLAVLRHGWCGHLCPLVLSGRSRAGVGLVKVPFSTRELHALRGLRKDLPGASRAQPEPRSAAWRDRRRRVHELRAAVSRSARDSPRVRCIRSLTRLPVSPPPSRGLPS